MPAGQFVGGVLAGVAAGGVAGFGLVTFFFTAGFLAGSVSSITVFLGAAEGPAESILSCARR